MTKDEELKTWKTWKKTKDPTQLNALVKSMDPFLQSYVNKFSASPLPRPAIESQARILAVKAFETYDPKKAALNTHVGHHMKHLARYVIEFQNVGKIPENRGIAISKFNNIKASLYDEFNREPNTIELAEALKWSPKEVERMQTELRSDLNVVQGKEEAFFDTSYNTTDFTRDIVEFVYYSSSPEEKAVLEYWFGLGGKPKLSVTDMSFQLNKTPEEIRKISKELAKRIADASM